MSEPVVVDHRYLVFTLGVECYATPLLEVREVVEYQPPKIMPNMAPHFAGVINIRGSIVGVVDLRKKLSVQEQNGAKPVLLVCDTTQGLLAAVVDRVDSVAEILDELIDKNPPVQSRIPTNYLYGVADLKGRLITVIHLQKSMSEDQISRAVA